MTLAEFWQLHSLKMGAHEAQQVKAGKTPDSVFEELYKRLP